MTYSIGKDEEDEDADIYFSKTDEISESDQGSTKGILDSLLIN